MLSEKKQKELGWIFHLQMEDCDICASPKNINKRFWFVLNLLWT